MIMFKQNVKDRQKMARCQKGEKKKCRKTEEQDIISGLILPVKKKRMCGN